MILCLLIVLIVFLRWPYKLLPLGVLRASSSELQQRKAPPLNAESNAEEEKSWHVQQHLENNNIPEKNFVFFALEVVFWLTPLGTQSFDGRRGR